MPISIRRIVTGHDAAGKAIITADQPIPCPAAAAGAFVATLWKTDTSPVDLTDTADGAEKVTGFVPAPKGTIFRVVEFPPNNPLNMHRTETLDYGIVLEGEIDMDLDDSTVHMKAGDIIIQCGTIHAWVNRGNKPCRIAFILMDAKV